MNASNARWVVCGLLLAATTLNYMDRVALNQLINAILRDLKLDDSHYALLESRFNIAFALGTLFCGWLVDRVNVRWIYPVVVLGWSLAGLATGYADSFTMLLACRVALGFFEAGNWPCGIRTTRTVLAPAERAFGNSLFQSGTAIGAIVTPIVILNCLAFFEKDAPNVWRIPFRVIGVIGFAWVGLWFALAPARLFPPPRLESQANKQSFFNVLADTRFWVLVLVILGVNIGWHTVRVWMPRLLSVKYQFDDRALQNFGIAYYLCADVGSWTVGLATLWFVKRGVSLDRVRMAAFAACTLLLLAATTPLPFVRSETAVLVLLLLTGFAALGLMPLYFAFSQDLSARHQGKVTGTLGFINAMIMSQINIAQGDFVKATQQYDTVIAMAGVPAAVAIMALGLYWKGEKA
jgi:ACS family hexuronate transporter-like MFS transporter